MFADLLELNSVRNGGSIKTHIKQAITRSLEMRAWCQSGWKGLVWLTVLCVGSEPTKFTVLTAGRNPHKLVTEKQASQCTRLRPRRLIF